MRNYKNSVKLSLVFTYLAIFLLFALTISLPALVTWYVEIKGRDHTLPATIMLTCYPCVPFAAVALFSLRRLLLNIMSDLIFGDKNIRCLKTVSICCLAIAAITIFAGHLYMPFYVAGTAAGFCALLSMTFKDIFSTALYKQREELYKSVEEEL